jgi:hypothetical protein
MIIKIKGIPGPIISLTKISLALGGIKKKIKINKPTKNIP